MLGRSSVGIDTALGAIQREKRLKAWLRQRKIDLVEKDNPDWRDLFDEIALGRRGVAAYSRRHAAA